jgi:hypothetical protein
MAKRQAKVKPEVDPENETIFVEETCIGAFNSNEWA